MSAMPPVNSLSRLTDTHSMRYAREVDPKNRKPGYAPVISTATLKPVPSHAFDLESGFRPIGGQWVMVHDLTLNSIGLRSRSPLDICSKYQVECQDRSLFLRDSRVRVISCRRADDGMYEIGTEICR
jgi:hypothetical protein